jgi:hypothetical protein
VRPYVIAFDQRFTSPTRGFEEHAQDVRGIKRLAEKGQRSEYCWRAYETVHLERREGRSQSSN